MLQRPPLTPFGVRWHLGCFGFVPSPERQELRAIPREAEPLQDLSMIHLSVTVILPIPQAASEDNTMTAKAKKPKDFWLTASSYMISEPRGLLVRQERNCHLRI
jgi:hypothetical protein